MGDSPFASLPGTGANYDQVGGPNAASNVSFSDPTGQYATAMKRFQDMLGLETTPYQTGTYDPNKAMGDFQAQVPGLTNMVAGATGPIGQMLSAQAARNSKMGGEAALAAMPGGGNSGAGQYAFGDAYSKAFADAAVGTQQAQLNMLNPLMGQALSGQQALAQQDFGGWQNWNQQRLQGQQAMQQGALNQYGQMAGRMGDLYTPTYERKKSGWDYFKDILGIGTSVIGAVK